MKYSIRHEQIGSRHKTVRRGYIRISEYSDSGIFLSKCNKLPIHCIKLSHCTDISVVMQFNKIIS